MPTAAKPTKQSPRASIRTLPTLTKNETLVTAGLEAREANVLVKVILNERWEDSPGVVDPERVLVHAFAEKMGDPHEIGTVGTSGVAFWITLRELHHMGKAMIEASRSAQQLMPSEERL